MNKAIDMTLPSLKLNKSTIEFISTYGFGGTTPEFNTLANQVMAFLHDRCSWGGTYDIDLGVSVLAGDSPLSVIADDADQFINEFVVKANDKMQFMVWLTQNEDPHEKAVKTEAKHLPIYIDAVLDISRAAGEDGIMNLNLFTELRSLMINLASAAKKITVGVGHDQKLRFYQLSYGEKNNQLITFWVTNNVSTDTNPVATLKKQNAAE